MKTSLGSPSNQFVFAGMTVLMTSDHSWKCMNLLLDINALELVMTLTNSFGDLMSAMYYLFACFSMFNSMLIKPLSLLRFIMSKRPFCCVLLRLIRSEPSLERIQTVGHKNVSLNYAMHLFYTDQVDEYTLVEHKSALSILVAPHPASCWPNTEMLNVKPFTKKTQPKVRYWPV